MAKNAVNDVKRRGVAPRQTIESLRDDLVSASCPG